MSAGTNPTVTTGEPVASPDASPAVAVTPDSTATPIPAQDAAAPADDVRIPREEVERLLEAERRRFQSIADRRVAEIEKKYQSGGTPASDAQASQAPQAAGGISAVDAANAGFTQEDIAKAWDNGTFPQVLEKIAEAKAERKAAEVFERKMQEREQQQKWEQDKTVYIDGMQRLQTTYGLSDPEMQRIADVSMNYVQQYGIWPNLIDAASTALGVNLESGFATALQARRTPPAPPVRQAPPVVGSDGSSIPSAPKHEGPLRPGGFQGML